MDPDQIACAIARLFYPRPAAYHKRLRAGRLRAPAAAFSSIFGPQRSPSRSTRFGVVAIVNFANSSAGAVVPRRRAIAPRPPPSAAVSRPARRRGREPNTARRSSCPDRPARSRCRRRSCGRFAMVRCSVARSPSSPAARRATISAKTFAVSYEYPDFSGTTTCRPYPPVVFTSAFSPISSSKSRTASATVASVFERALLSRIEIEDHEVRLVEPPAVATSKRAARSSRGSRDRRGSARRCRPET